MTAAIFCKRTDPECRVKIYERMDRVGKKLLVTGNGQCNLSNIYISLEKYHGGPSDFVMQTFSVFGYQATIDFFAEIGVLTKTDQSGRIYPYSFQASSVLDALRFECERLGVQTVLGCEVTDLRRRNDGFQFTGAGRQYYADRIILCGGGRSSAQCGSNGSCYSLLRQTGHTITELFPAIVQVCAKNTNVARQLKGIKLNATASVLVNGQRLRQETGEVLFTDYGLSGPPILQLSRIISTHMSNGNTVEITLNLLPEYRIEQVKAMLVKRAAAISGRCMDQFFGGLINKRVGQVVVKGCNIPSQSHAGSLTAQDMNALCATLQNFSFVCRGTRGFANAQVTAGGAQLDQFIPATMESRSMGGLYCCGELLDVDGDCGGYNLQWAWSSGACAGKACALSFKQRF